MQNCVCHGRFLFLNVILMVLEYVVLIRKVTQVFD